MKSLNAAKEYLAGTTVWDFPVLKTEGPDARAQEEVRWANYLTTLDTALLSMLGEQDVSDDQIEVMLDEVLTCSLWTRRLRHRTGSVQQLLKFGLAARAKFIWGRTSDIQRRGYFLAGVGLETGEALDAAAPELNELLTQANGAILLADAEMAITSITRFAECVFGIAPFTPDSLPADWKAILRLWLEGNALVGLAAGREDEVLKFVEQALVYKLPWAMEAVRVRGLAHNDTLEGGFSMEDVELGVAVSAVEAGSLNISAAMLMRAGFSSRLAAIHAVTETGAEFGSMSDLRAWLRSDEVASRRSDPEWPTSATHTLWVQFIEGLTPQQGRTWSVTEVDMDVKWKSKPPSSGVPLRLVHRKGETLVCGADYQPLGELKTPLNPARRGVTLATVGWFDDLELRYIGPGDLTR